MKARLLEGTMLDVPRVSPLVPSERAPRWSAPTPAQVLESIRRAVAELDRAPLG